MHNSAPLSTQTETGQKERDLLRQGFNVGAMWCASYAVGHRRPFQSEVEEAAQSTYPDPPQPREITLSDGFKYRLENDAFWVWRYTGDGFKWILAVIHAHTLSVNDLRLLADLREVSHG